MIKPGLALLNIIYPVGSVYISVNEINPQTIFGGIWEQIKDRFLLACGDKYTNGAIGGEENHTLTIGEMPEHRHELGYDTGVLLAAGNERGNAGTGSNYGQGWFTKSIGGNQPHNNMPPYFALYMWKRIE